MKTTITLLIMALTASFAAADSAWLQMAPGSTPKPGGILEIQLVADGEVEFWNLDGACGPAGTSVSNFQTHPNAGANGWEALPKFIDNYTSEGLTYLWNAANCQSNSALMPAGEVLMSFDLQIHDTWDGVTPFTLNLLEAGESYYYDGGSEPINYDPKAKVNGQYVPIADLTIPEPATLCLLAGGGISMLLRRKRAKNN